MQYGLQQQLSTTYAKIDTLIIPRKSSDGTVARGVSQDGTQYIGTMLRRGTANAAYATGHNDPQSLNVVGVELNQQTPYWLTLERSASAAVLRVDGLDGQYSDRRVYNDILMTESTEIAVDSNRVFLGADSERVTDDFVGCVGDFRWNDVTLPLEQTQSTQAVTLKQRQGVKDDRCADLVRTCATTTIKCDEGQVCRDFWKGPFCTCPEGQSASLNNNGLLIGCGAALAVRTLGITNWAVTAIIVCLFLLLRTFHIIFDLFIF
jgi:hypothetical protein